MPCLKFLLLYCIGTLWRYVLLSSYMIYENLTQSQLFSQLANWFMFYCFTRTLSNSLETVLTVVSLYFWPCMRSSNKCSFVSRKWGLILAALACAIRPTSAITWLYVGLLELLKGPDRLKFILLEVAPIGYVLAPFTHSSWLSAVYKGESLYSLNPDFSHHALVRKSKDAFVSYLRHVSR